MEYNEFIHHILNITMVEFKGQVDPVEPLLLCHMPGIPKKSRRRELGEPTARVKIAKSRSTIRCNFNLKLGHNKRNCPISSIGSNKKVDAKVVALQ